MSNAYCHVQLTLDVDPADLAKRCSIRDRIIKVYNKTKWKGGRLKVEEAKPDFRSRAQAEEIEKNDTPEVGDMDEISDNEYENALQKKKMLRIRKKRGRRGVFYVSADKKKCITGRRIESFDPMPDTAVSSLWREEEVRAPVRILHTNADEGSLSTKDDDDSMADGEESQSSDAEVDESGGSDASDSSDDSSSDDVERKIRAEK